MKRDGTLLGIQFERVPWSLEGWHQLTQCWDHGEGGVQLARGRVGLEQY